jgi:hypothetical protein
MSGELKPIRSRMHKPSGAYVFEAFNDGSGFSDRQSFDTAECWQCGERFSTNPCLVEQTCPLCEEAAPVATARKDRRENDRMLHGRKA